MPNRFWNKRRAIPAAWILASVYGLAVYCSRSDPSSTFSTNIDWIHQAGLLEWFHRSIFEGAGPLLSPTFYFPSPGVMATSEIPFLQGFIHALLRETGAGIFLSWHIVFALCSLSNVVAAYAAVKGEGFSEGTAITAAIVYGSYYTWLPDLGNGLWYRTGFGLPLAWHFLTRLKRDGGPAPVVGLAAVLVLQFLACMTNALSALAVVAVRVGFDGGLRREWKAALLAVLPVAAAGAGYSWWSRGAAAAMELPGRSELLKWQVTGRIELVNLFGLDRTPYCPDGIPLCNLGGVSPPVIILVLAAAAVGFALRHNRDVPALPPAAPRTWMIFAAAGLALVYGFVRPFLAIDTVTVPEPAWMVTALLTVAAVWGHFRFGPAIRTRTGDDVYALAVLAALSVAVSLGPVVFAFGRMVAVGPLALLDLIVPGVERVRFPSRFLLPAGWALVMLAAMGLERVSSRWRIVNTLAVLNGVVHLATRMQGGLYTWPDPQVRPFNVRLDNAACPACSDTDLRTLPLPYERIRRSGGALLELPAGPLSADSGATRHDSVHQFYWLLDGTPRLTGFSTWSPGSYYGLLESVRAFPSEESIQAARIRGARWVLVHGNRYPPDDWTRLQDALDPPPSGLVLERKWGPVWLFRVE